MKRLPVPAVALVFGAALLSACSGDFTEPIGPDGPDLDIWDGTPVAYLKVLKVGPAGTYDFEASETATENGGLLYSSFSLEAGSTLENAPRLVIWQQDDPTGPPSDVTVTEVPVPGMQVDSIIVRVRRDGGPVVWHRYTGTNTVTVQDLDTKKDAAIKFFNSEAPGGGTEGCTPGYWRQPHHVDSWVGYAPGDLYNDVFGVDYDDEATLLDAVWARGGGANALARHSVAALLNATSSDVDYAATAASVIAAVQDAFASGDLEEQKDIFEGWNEAGCPLD